MGISSLDGSQLCGTLGAGDIGRQVCVAGWVHVNRDLGGLVFVELRDATGKVQLVADPNRNKKVHEVLCSVRCEYVIIACGTVLQRPEGRENKESTTGSRRDLSG